MRILIIKNYLVRQNVLKDFFSAFGNCDFAEDGDRAVEAYRNSWTQCKPYDLICMDTIMPAADKLCVVQKLRETENEFNVDSSEGVKIIMATAADKQDAGINTRSRSGVKACIFKPAVKHEFLEETCILGLHG